MTQTIDKTLAERGERYGEFIDHAEVTQSIKCAMASGDNWDTLPDDMKECLEMVAHKLGRILNGDPDYIDSWTDIIGYTRLVEKRLIEDADAETEPCQCEACKPPTYSNMASIAEALESFRKKYEGDAKPAGKPSDEAVKAALETLLNAGVVSLAE